MDELRQGRDDPLGPVRLILSDLGGVVVRIDPARCHRCWAELSQRPVDEVARLLYPDEVYEAFERGEVSSERYLAHVRETLGTDIGDAALGDCFNRILLGVDRDALEVFEDQRCQGMRLAALTNTNELHHRRWSVDYAEELEVFETIHLSFELGARKPEPGCFEKVLEREGLSPGEVVFVDDVPGHVAAAARLGMSTVHFRSAEQLERDLTRALT
ncbi:MAG: HAD family phosphatase [Nitriliruptorales bacterium]|nr:HAD family phosphatase [Nitriliruptorales bacterium]